MSEGFENLLIGIGTILVIVLCCGLLVGGCAGAKSFQRAQKRADASNRVKVTHINIRNAQQQAQVIKAQNAIVAAKAQQRLIEAVGIRKAQDEISATLTDKYLQHEAIKAQAALANSPNHSTIYIPSGQNGLPLVTTAAK